MTLLIKNGTKRGFIELNLPGIADLSYPKSSTRRGRVQQGGEICPTLMVSNQGLYVFIPVDEKGEFDNEQSQNTTVR